MVGILQVQNQNWVLRGIAVFWQTVTNIIEHAAKAGCAREKGETGETGEDWRFEEAFIKCLKSIKKRFLWLNYWTQFWRCKGIYKSSTWNVKRQNFDFQCLLVLYFGNKLVTEKKECSRISFFWFCFLQKHLNVSVKTFTGLTFWQLSFVTVVLVISTKVFSVFQKLFSILQCNFAFVVFRNVVCGKHKFQRWGLCPLQPGWPRFSVRFTQLCHVALCSMPAALRVLLFVSAARYRAPASPQCTVVAW